MFNYVFKKRPLKIIIAAVDILGYIIFTPYMVFRKLFGALRSPSTILVVRLDQTGDVIQAIPFVNMLRRKYPSARICALVTKNNEFLLKGSQSVDKIYTLDTSWFYKGKKLPFSAVSALIRELKKEKIDFGFDLRGDIRNIALLFFSGVKKLFGYGCAGGGFMLDVKKPYDRETHEIDKNLRLIDEGPVARAEIYFSVAAELEAQARELVKKNNAENVKKIMVHPFAGADSKLWGYERYNSLIKMVLNASKDAVAYITGGPEDKKFENQFDFGPRVINVIGMRYQPTIALIKKCAVFIGNDSSIQYFAAYSGVKTCVIYGYTLNYRRWAPKIAPEDLIAFSKGVECGPCEKADCDRETHKCMDLITVEEVFEGVKGWL